MKIAFIGKFGRLYDEEYIARSFEMIGHQVFRIPQHTSSRDIGDALTRIQPNLLLYCKWEQSRELDETISKLQLGGMKTVCWLFDLYFGYARQNQLAKRFFRSDYVFTTDGGHDEEWKALGINHHCVRQGIYAPECFMQPFNPVYDVIFVGSENLYFPERTDMMTRLSAQFNFKWFGRTNTDELRGTELNDAFAHAKVVVGDSVYSPNYWSNRVVETLGRGGFLIHCDVPGITEEYPHLPTYRKGDLDDLESIIKTYLRLERDRHQLVQMNFEFVRDNYTMEKKCQELLSYIS